MSEVWLVTIATGRYQMFLPRLLDTAQANLVGFAGAFVLSDRALDADLGAIHLPWGHAPWPFPTLLRYRAMLAYAPELSRAEVLMYVDADMAFVDTIDLGSPSGLIAVQHPGFVSAAPEDLPFERRPESRAHVVPDTTSTYVAGGFQGGNAETYLAAAKTMSQQIQDDLSRGIIPVWHDESVWNRFVIDHPPELVLDSTYCWPEEKAHANAKLLALAKNHDEVRETPWRTRMRRRARRLTQRARSRVTRLLRPLKRRVLG